MNETSKMIICGRLGKNPELRYTKTQKAVCTLTIACPTDNNQQPEWHRIVVWDKQAENCNLHLQKGSEIFVRGRKIYREFINHEGEKKEYVEINADLIGYSLL